MSYEKEDLKRSSVVFDEIPHTYMLGGKMLSGITGMIKDYVFPNKYKGIPKKVLDAAAARGHELHSQVQMIVDGYGCNETDPSVNALFDWQTKNHIEFIASEYLVSDEQHWATAIDILDSELNLYDIKTVRTMDEEMKDYLRWQLSTCAYLFELQNPDKKVNELFGIWLHDKKATPIKVERIDNAIIADLLCAAADGLPWSNPFESVAVDILNTDEVQRVVELETRIAEFESKVKELQEQRETFREKMLNLMLETNTKLWKSPNGKVVLSVRNGSVRSTFDSKRFAEDFPELYENYKKVTLVNPSLTIKINV